MVQVILANRVKTRQHQQKKKKTEEKAIHVNVWRLLFVAAATFNRFAILDLSRTEER